MPKDYLQMCKKLNNEPLDMSSNFCFHDYAQNSFVGLTLKCPIEEVPLLSLCAPSAAPAAMLSKIPDYNATRNTKLSTNVIGDPSMQMPTC